MACMEHTCHECGDTWFDNKPSGTCKGCGSDNVSHLFDEQEDEDWDAVNNLFEDEET